MVNDATQWITQALGINEAPVIWLTDIDDTLIDTKAMHGEAAPALISLIAQMIGRAQAVSLIDRFQEIFDELLSAHQRAGGSEEPKTHLDDRVEACQADIRTQWGVTKRFSREVLLWLAAQDSKVTLNAEQLASAADAYWQHMTRNPLVFSDAVELFAAIKERTGRHPLLMTSSDARFTLSPTGQFSYDPVRSREFKRTRVRALAARGFPYESVFIGDPVDKPDPKYFENVFRSIEKKLDPPQDYRIMVVGDSFSADIATPLAINDRVLGVLCKRGHAEPKQLDARTVTVGSLAPLSTALRLGMVGP